MPNLASGTPGSEFAVQFVSSGRATLTPDFLPDSSWQDVNLKNVRQMIM